jgi:hypothetical protein
MVAWTVFMTDVKEIPSADDTESLPAPGNVLVKVLRKTYHFLASAKLALVLLIVILVCCIAGVTVVRGQRAGALIFSTLWFNTLLVLLIINVGFCFFGRIRGRKLTLISSGMILFHLSFIAMFAGIIFNSLFYFRGSIRLTEGETLPSGQLQSYDYAEQGRFFDYASLRGETTLIRMWRGYKVDNSDMRAAYEIAVGEGSSKTQGVIYITKNLGHDGFRYFPDKEGYSLLVVLYDKKGKELYGAYVPLQSLKQKDGTFLYTTGTKDGPGSFSFPQGPARPQMDLLVAYQPSSLRERTGKVFFRVSPVHSAGSKQEQKVLAEGTSVVGAKFPVGVYHLSAKQVRYWAAMNVRYDPGLPIVLTSFWAALGGLVTTFIGRMRKEKQRAIDP